MSTSPDTSASLLERARVTGDPPEIRILDRKTGRQLERFIAPEVDGDWDASVIKSVSPGGRLAVQRGRKGGISLWQPGPGPLRSRKIELAPKGGHSEMVAFSPDGRYLAVASLDGKVILLRLVERGQVPNIHPKGFPLPLPPSP